MVIGAQRVVRRKSDFPPNPTVRITGRANHPTTLSGINRESLHQLRRPNFDPLDTKAAHGINVFNTGNAVTHLSVEFRFAIWIKSLTVPAGNGNVAVAPIGKKSIRRSALPPIATRRRFSRGDRTRRV